MKGMHRWQNTHTASAGSWHQPVESVRWQKQFIIVDWLVVVVRVCLRKLTTLLVFVMECGIKWNDKTPHEIQWWKISLTLSKYWNSTHRHQYTIFPVFKHGKFIITSDFKYVITVTVTITLVLLRKQSHKYYRASTIKLKNTISLQLDHQL